MAKKNKTWPTWKRDDKSVVSCTEKIKVMGDNFDETSIQSGKTAASRNLQSRVIKIIDEIYEATRTHATTLQILEATRAEGFDDDRVIGYLEQAKNAGNLFAPGGYGTWQSA